eukprot:403369551
MEKLFSNVMVCKSCNQKYNLSKRKPMISVECLHKACKNCIESKFQKVQEGIICFQCEEITQPDKYKNDPEIQTILQDFSLLPICCDNHPNLSADFLCLDCEELVCNSCSQTHHDSHIINEQKISLEIFEEYLTNAAAMLDRHISPIQALLMEVRQLKENESEIKSSEFMQIYKKVTTFLCTQIFNQHELLKVDLKNYFMTENADANENGKKVLIRNHKHERKEQDLQTEMYKQNSLNSEIDKDDKSLLVTAEMEDYSNKSFKLLYQGSRDGFIAQALHQKCDNQGPTVWFILSEYGQTFGFYTSISQQSEINGSFFPDEKAFIFQLSQRSIHKQYQNQEYAVYHQNNRLCYLGHGGYSYNC